MSTYPDIEGRSRVGTMLGVVASIGTLAVLWIFRPSLASLAGLPRSLTEPLTATGLQDFGLLLAWAALACLAVLVLVRALGSTAHPRRTVGAHHERGSHPSRGKGSRPTGAARHSRSQASTPRSSAFQDQVVLTLTAPVEAQPGVEQEPREEAPDVAPAISVSVLGPLQITGGKRRRRIRASAQELIAYLAFHPDGASRDQLLEALWPGEDPKRSEQRLWQSTSDVRRVLGDVVRRDRDRYRLDRVLVSIDLDEFNRLLVEAGRVRDATAQREGLEQALAVFRGEPLEGTNYTWADGELRRLHAVIVELLEHLGRARLEGGDARGALAAAERGIAIDSLDEGFWRLALDAEGELGARQAIEERYERLRVLLNERLGLEPAQETRTLYLRLLGQN